MKKYRVQIYYTSFCTYEVEANSKQEAILKARKTTLKKGELLSNLESWKEADNVEKIEIKDEKSKV